MAVIRRIAFALVLSLGLALGLLGLLGGWSHVTLADPGVLYVAPGGDCGGVTPCYATVQAAVDAASPGDEIRVATGTYTGVSARAGVTQTVYISKTVTIRGGYTIADWTTPDPAGSLTTLDAQGRGRVLHITGDISPVVEGLRITGGNAAGLGGHSWGDTGGGVDGISATATISNNQVLSNTARHGGGLYLNSSDATLSNNTISNNTAAGSGGGLWLSSSPATISGNTISGNTGSYWGGGLYLRKSDAILSSNVIYSNTITVNYGGGVGLDNSNATLSGNHIYGNTAVERGGGVFLSESNATLNGNIVTGNSTALWGGGLYLSPVSNAMMTNNVIVNNRANLAGSGLYIWGSSSHLLHTTIAHNSGGYGSGVYITDYGSNYSTVAMTNTILVSHTVGIAVAEGNTATLNATLWYANDTDYSSNVIHANDHSGDPAFAPDGYHLTLSSAAIDAGVDAGVTTDIDGDTRPQGSGPDLGADELRMWRTYLPVALRKR